MFSFLPTLGFVFLTVSVASSINRSRHDPGMLAFVILSYVNLLLLYWCLDRLEMLGPNSPPERRKRLQVAIWVLATALNLALAWRVADVMPWALAVAAWSMAAFVAVAGFYGLFIYEDETK